MRRRSCLILTPRGQARAQNAAKVDHAESDEEEPKSSSAAKAHDSDAMDCDGDEYDGKEPSDGNLEEDSPARSDTKRTGGAQNSGASNSIKVEGAKTSHVSSSSKGVSITSTSKTSKAATGRPTNDKRAALARVESAATTADMNDGGEQPKFASAIAGQICNALSVYEARYPETAFPSTQASFPERTPETVFAERAAELEASKAPPKAKSTSSNAQRAGERKHWIPLGDASHTESANGGAAFFAPRSTTSSRVQEDARQGRRPSRRASARSEIMLPVSCSSGSTESSHGLARLTILTLRRQARSRHRDPSSPPDGQTRRMAQPRTCHALADSDRHEHGPQ